MEILKPILIILVGLGIMAYGFFLIMKAMWKELHKEDDKQDFFDRPRPGGHI